MIYFLAFSVVFLFAHIAKKHKNSLQLFFFIISGLVLVMLAAVREETVGIDVGVYVKRYFLIAQRTDNIFVYLKAINKELLYYIITFCATKLFGSLQAVFFFNELIIVGFTYAAIWNLKDNIHIDISVLAFSFIFYGQSLNIARQAMAMAIVLYAFSKLLQGRKNTAFVFWIISIGFHYSAVVCIGIYLIYIMDKRKLNYKIKLCFLLMLFFLQLFYDKIFTFIVIHLSFLPRGYVSSKYLYREYSLSSCNLALYSLCALLALFLLVRHKPGADFWFYIVGLSLCGVFIGAKSTFANRIFYYVEYLLIIMLGRKDIFPVKQTPGNVIIADSFLCIVLMVHFYILQIYLNVAGIFPYRSIFFQ